MYKFGMECAETKRFDTNVPCVLIDVLVNIDGELGDKGDVWRKHGVYENVKRVLDGLAQDPSHADGVRGSWNHSWAMSLGAAIAIHARNYDDARQLLDRLGKDVRADAFQRRGLSYPQDAARAYALSGSVREDVAAFEDLLQEKGLQDGEARRTARKLIEGAAAKNRDAAAKPYFESRKTLFDWHDRFERGDWVDLQFDTQLLWVVRQGEWNLQNEHGIVGRVLATQTNYQERLDCRTEFRVPMEIEPGRAMPPTGPGRGTTHRPARRPPRRLFLRFRRGTFRCGKRLALLDQCCAGHCRRLGPGPGTPWCQRRPGQAVPPLRPGLARTLRILG